MTNKTLHSLFGFAYHENAKKVVISGSETGLSFNCHLPDGEEAIFNLPKRLETELAANLRHLLEIAPGELAAGKYCKLSDKNYHLSFRLSIIPDKFGEKIIINIIDEEKNFMNLSNLGLQKKDLDIIKHKINTKAGLIVISSPETQGRSSTLYSLLSELNQENKNIYFIHDKAETQLNGINYLPNTPENWDRILHQDSDIIAIDTKHSGKHLAQAITAASTGRLVLITTEAVNTLEALYQLLKTDLPLKLVLDSLKMIISQELTNLKRVNIKNIKGRKKIGLFEIMVPDKKIADFILKNETNIKTKEFWQKLLQLLIDNGYRPISNDIKQKELDGLI
jgi:type II secretory ATPase GspE/PulE/Tfp pilus assembly ATPase PilB-like protein